ncbi:hypothetical protein [Streptomyces avermitilis]|uniref:hypothetical protein n=1 Tax=Streptomyces avermitilis TaxID=33903 RepID=UPI002017BA1F|nr:hypothetical protein [Streptomyces avermitilis]
MQEQHRGPVGLAAVDAGQAEPDPVPARKGISSTRAGSRRWWSGRRVVVVLTLRSAGLVVESVVLKIIGCAP